MRHGYSLLFLPSLHFSISISISISTLGTSYPRIILTLALTLQRTISSHPSIHPINTVPTKCGRTFLATNGSSRRPLTLF
ncbi:hypothetical protein F4813DRAFT_351006 [Daldinia decipiens]|uniref:uncharacterized protein n=1 Tax=Daldinia decipiens TaxID=326647 RepID=UPI0020C422FF|nr:uncharacterized protein F4813DRAFT_351006 [Daldinia decipiens]KAI1660117.1 hypothetical protein F4813DRAFT_351006 [Daldinia decipiens]